MKIVDSNWRNWWHVVLLCGVAMLAGCAQQPPWAARLKPPTMVDGWKMVKQHDLDVVNTGKFWSPKVLEVDQEIIAIIPEGEQIQAANDKKRAAVWADRYNALLAERSAILQDGNNKAQAWFAQHPEALAALRRAQAEDASRENLAACVDAATGRDTCTTPPPAPPNYGNTGWCQVDSTGALEPCGN